MGLHRQARNLEHARVVGREDLAGIEEQFCSGNGSAIFVGQQFAAQMSAGAESDRLLGEMLSVECDPIAGLVVEFVGVKSLTAVADRQLVVRGSLRRRQVDFEGSLLIRLRGQSPRRRSMDQPNVDRCACRGMAILAQHYAAERFAARRRAGEQTQNRHKLAAHNPPPPGPTVTELTDDNISPPMLSRK